MKDFLQSFDNRDIAICLWSLVLFCYVLRSESVRDSLIDLLKSLAHKKIIMSLIVFLAYYIFVVCVTKLFGLWALSQLKLTIIWFLFVGVPGLASSIKVDKGFIDFSKLALSNLSLSVLFEFFINVYKFPLVIELIFVPLVTLITWIVVYAGYHDEHKNVEVFGKKIIHVIGGCVIFYAMYNLVFDFDELLKVDNLRQFILPLIYSVGVIPALWLSSVYSVYDSVFTMIPLRSKNKSVHNYLRLSLAVRFRFNTELLYLWFSESRCHDLESKVEIDESINKVIGDRFV
ncbi:hypothetical protein [Plesiomonas sp. PI-19]|uniref:hypothetical protein n=1 Tax=Plesiomonas sp. PI-19 TaxID=2898798 RepID=UPI001F3DD2EC|nr:hypothetical protein [Plesiomonas sp. PI-19]MCE5163756.1 hypothetical protein [Plesiomonas sp. PI-19]